MTNPPASQMGLSSRSSAARNETSTQRNVAEAERWASLLGGGALALYGLLRATPGGLAAALLGGALVYRGVKGHCPCYAALGINTAERHGGLATIPAESGIKVTRSIRVLRPAGELFQFWRDFENLPRIMRHLESVDVTAPNRSHWVAKGPLAMRFEWDAEIISEKDNDHISWRSIEGSEIDTAGSVHFVSHPDRQSTEIRVVLKYNPPAGKFGAAIAGLLGESPDRQIEEDLRTFKWIMEFGRMSRLPDL
jgi:uncharacterized membrane protein